VHGTGVYSAGVGPKGPALERFLDIKKKKKKKIHIMSQNHRKRENKSGSGYREKNRIL
jgi:hypothetical protein